MSDSERDKVECCESVFFVFCPFLGAYKCLFWGTQVSFLEHTSISKSVLIVKRKYTVKEALELLFAGEEEDVLSSALDLYLSDDEEHFIEGLDRYEDM